MYTAGVGPRARHAQWLHQESTLGKTLHVLRPIGDGSVAASEAPRRSPGSVYCALGGCHWPALAAACPLGLPSPLYHPPPTRSGRHRTPLLRACTQLRPIGHGSVALLKRLFYGQADCFTCIRLHIRHQLPQLLHVGQVQATLSRSHHLPLWFTA